MTQMPPIATLHTSTDAPLGQAMTHHGASVLIGEGLRAIVAERMEQVQTHGYTIARDQTYSPFELPLAAASYLNAAIDQLGRRRDDIAAPDPATWLWPDAAWKPGAPRANLIKAIALAWAAVDYLDHAPIENAGVPDDDIECAFCMRPACGIVVDGEDDTFDACLQCVIAERNDPGFFGDAPRKTTNNLGRTCRDCGCTDERACMDGDQPCSWIAPDLCSACEPVSKAAAA